MIPIPIVVGAAMAVVVGFIALLAVMFLRSEDDPFANPDYPKYQRRRQQAEYDALTLEFYRRQAQTGVTTASAQMKATILALAAFQEAGRRILREKLADPLTDPGWYARHRQELDTVWPAWEPWALT